MLGKHPAIDYKLTLNETFFIFRLCLHYYIPKGGLKVVILLPWLPRQLRLQVCVPSLCFSSIQASTADWLEKQVLLSTGPGSLLPHVILHHVTDRSWGLTLESRLADMIIQRRPCELPTGLTKGITWGHFLPPLLKFPFISYPLCHNINW